MRATDREAGLTAERLRQVLDYDSDIGVFLWRAGSRRAGKVAGRVTELGYRDIRVDGRLYFASRLAWLHMTGEWPQHEVDHRNRNRGDNAWRNLRAADHGQNQCNALRVVRDLPRGVYPREGKFRAQIRKYGKLTNLGTFSTPESASRAYQAAAQERHGVFAYPND